MSKRTITVVGRDNSNTQNAYEAVLIYAVEVEDANDAEAVLEAFEQARMDETGWSDDPDSEDYVEMDCEVLFAFEGVLNPIADWRY